MVGILETMACRSLMFTWPLGLLMDAGYEGDVGASWGTKGT